MLMALAASVLGSAWADKTEAETCIEEKIWSQYKEGWQVRTAMTAVLAWVGQPLRTA